MAVSTETLRTTALLLLVAATAGCNKEPPPRSVEEFVENPILLEAAVVRCAANRSETRYDAECVNARQAAKRLDSAKAEARRAELEAQSERKRQQLRRTQQAAAEARRLAAEEQQRREEAEYLQQFGVLPESADDDGAGGLSGNEPGAVLPEAPANDSVAAEPIVSPYDEPQPAATTWSETNTPAAEVVTTEPTDSPANTPADPPADLEAIREELRRRGQSDESG